MAAPAGAPTEAELREVVMRGEQLRQQLAGLESQRELVTELAGEARAAFTALEHLEKAKAGDETLVPLGAGAFLRARIDDPTKALASLGTNIHAELPVADARARMTARSESLDNANGQLVKEINRVADELARINALLEQAYGGA